MGLLFNRGAGFKKFVPSSALSKATLKSVSREAGIMRHAGQREFREMLRDDKKGGLKRDEVHDEIQKLVAERLISTPHQARKIALTLGLKGKQLTHFQSASHMHVEEAHAAHVEAKNETRAQVGHEPHTQEQPVRSMHEGIPPHASPTEHMSGQSFPSQPALPTRSPNTINFIKPGPTLPTHSPDQPAE